MFRPLTHAYLFDKCHILQMDKITNGDTICQQETLTFLLFFIEGQIIIELIKVVQLGNLIIPCV